MYADSAVLGVYKKFNFDPKRADGVYLYGRNKEKVLDFSGGIAVNVLGYNSKIVERALITQLHKGFFAQSNLFYNEEQEKLAKKMCKLAGFFAIEHGKVNITGKTFFCNSGAEANECAIKTARKRYNVLCDRDYNEIICFDNAFHGRTIATISAVQRKKITLGFEPTLKGFQIAKFNDIKSVEKLITEHTSAVMLETIQGEGGVCPCDKQFLIKLRELCTYHKIGLILDEVQCGNGRSGTYFAFEKYGIKPDIITTAKGIAGGLPMGVCIMNEEFAKYMVAGSHGCTFGGNALCCSVANSVVNILSNKRFLLHVQYVGKELKEMLKMLSHKYNNVIQSVSGIGLMIGLKIRDEISNRTFAEILLSNGLSSAPASNNTIRFLPPLIIESKHIKEAKDIIELSIQQLSIIERY